MRIRNPLGGTLGALLLLLSAAATAHATTAVAVSDIATLTKRADEVVRGTVGSMRTVLEKQQIFTYIELQVQEALKGAAGPRSVSVKVLGGEANGLRTRVVGAPCLGQREEVVLFLKKDTVSPSFQIVNLAEGKFSVVRNASGAAPGVTRDLSGIHYLENLNISIPTTYEELARAVRAAR